MLSGLAEKLTASLGGAVQQLLQLRDSDLADIKAAEAAESAEDDEDEGEAYAATAALLRSHHLLLVAQPSPASVSQDTGQHAAALLKVLHCMLLKIVIIPSGLNAFGKPQVSSVEGSPLSGRLLTLLCFAESL